jgi:hypothetical protein
MQILRLRFLDQAHNFVTFGRENDKSIFWADIYNGNQGFVVYGHQKYSSNNLYPKRLNLRQYPAHPHPALSDFS